MDADRSREPVTDSVVDREMQAILAVDPSPEFLARVRARIADEPQPAAWWLSWRLAAAAAATALAVIAVFAARPRPAEAPQVLAAVTAPNTTTTLVPSVVSNAPSAFRRTIPGPAEAGPHAPREPDVLLDARESSTLRALIFGVRSGTVDLEPVLRASTPSAMELPPIGTIAISPITIDPLEEGVRQ